MKVQTSTYAPSSVASQPENGRPHPTVAAVIVLYCPVPYQLDRLAASVIPQIDSIFLIDNTPDADGELPAAFQNCPRPVFYHRNGVNRGIATAQNTGIELAMREGYSHILLLDQDSALPAETVEGLLAAERSLLEAGRNVAAVGPQFFDEKDGRRCRTVGPGWIRVRWYQIPAGETNPVECDHVIASGSLIRTSVLATVGGMLDELFIDWVDVEWAYRAKRFGYATYIVPTVMMMHSVGEETRQLLGQYFNLHSPARNYYIVRNAAYLLKKRHMSWRWRATMLSYIPKYILVHSWLSQNRWRSLCQMLRGVWEGMAGTMEPFSA